MDTSQLNVKIPAELDKQLEIYCIQEDAKKKEVVAEALKQFLQNK